MEKLFERHDAYLQRISMAFVRPFVSTINWGARLIAIKGPKGVE